MRSTEGGCGAIGSLIVDLTSKSGMVTCPLCGFFISMLIGIDVVFSGRSLGRESTTTGDLGRSGMIGISRTSSSAGAGSSLVSIVSS